MYKYKEGGNDTKYNQNTQIFNSNNTKQLTIYIFTIDHEMFVTELINNKDQTKKEKLKLNKESKVTTICRKYESKNEKILLRLIGD